MLVRDICEEHHYPHHYLHMYIIITCGELLVLLIKSLDLLLKDPKVGINLLGVSLDPGLQPQDCVSMLWGRKYV